MTKGGSRDDEKREQGSRKKGAGTTKKVSRDEGRGWDEECA